MRVLLVEDQEEIAEPLATGLRREGFDVTWVASAAAALAASEHDLVLLDLRLPDRDGYEVCRELRARSSVPIIVISARGEEIDRIVGLELGADDYLVKPFGFRELLARINAVTRRTGSRPPEAGTLRVGELTVDTEGRRVLLERRGDRTDCQGVRSPGGAGGPARRGGVAPAPARGRVGLAPPRLATKTIDVHVATLRRKLGDPGWIQTVRGVGFRLRGT